MEVIQNHVPFWGGVGNDFHRFCAIASNAIYLNNEESVKILCSNRLKLSPFVARARKTIFRHKSGAAMVIHLHHPRSRRPSALVVFRGTLVMPDYLQDIYAAFGAALPSVSELLAWVRIQIAPYTMVFFTGHSLGGFLAETLAISESRVRACHCAAIVFNAPGPHALDHMLLGIFAGGRHPPIANPRLTVIHHRIDGDPVSAIEHGVRSTTRFYEWPRVSEWSHGMSNFLSPS
ncbi:hypothetical protein PAPYR_12405 [Paratrimastix pyriformis]|uniref:Fungal lipase-like domain-containing protein n=1 Tax=Paratrimastix pyriformis TaxID=342808 RepID=A0ABQ8U6H4_9EUKA|nr:hypothetical protein PAPYR_12405 [Paratrimastix pyriformis]